MMAAPLVMGIDLGTSGARAVVCDETMTIVAQAAAPLSDFGVDHRDPAVWWRAVETALDGVLQQTAALRVACIAVDGTSGTVLPVDAAGARLAQPLMYNDAVADDGLLQRIAPLIPAASAAHGPTSGLAKALHFQPVPGVARILHQADWIAGRLCGRFGFTDANNALKTGYDPVAGAWPEWIVAAGLNIDLLPEVFEPGQPVAPVSFEMAKRFGLSEGAMIIAGTTDGCASFLATGAGRPGDGVTALGSTLTLKLLSDVPVFAPDYGIYSHKVLGMWLAGGASNTGGKVLASFFDSATIAALSADMNPDQPAGLGYYPLLKPGERFPISDAHRAPVLEPRPVDDRLFLQGLFEGIADIEALGYSRLAELGAPRLRSVRSVGGGAANPAWSAIRQKKLGVLFEPVRSSEAAAGAARIALAGLRAAGVAA
jgi:sugar (pentulose or hexulose) kinase